MPKPKKYTKAERAAAKAEKLWRQAKASCETFIQKYVKIEDRDAVESGEELAIPFAMWDGQKHALQTFLTERLTVVLKARQLGLTWLALAYTAWRILFFPGYSAVGLSKREDDAKELTRRLVFILRHLPKWMIREKKQAGSGFAGPVWEATSLTVTVYHPDGESSVFRAETSGPDSGRSFTSNLVLLDEWAFQQFAEEIWSAAYPTVNRPTGGQVIGLSTNKRGSLFEKVCQDALAGKNNFKLIFLPVWTDPRRTHGWYAQTKIDLPDSWMQEYPETIEQAFSAGEGTAFPEFSADVHVIEPFPIPEWWRRWMGHDPGYDNPFYWCWFAVDDDGTVYLYREYGRDPKEPKVFYSDQGTKVCELSKYYDPETDDYRYEEIDFIVTGKDAFNKSRETGKTYIDYYREGGLDWVGFVPAITDRRMRKAVMHEYLKPVPDKENQQKMAAKLRVFNTCRHFISTLPQLVKDENDAEKVADNPEIDGPYDGAGYGLIAYHVGQSKAPEPEKGQIAKLKEKLAKTNRRFGKRLA